MLDFQVIFVSHFALTIACKENSALKHVVYC